MLSVEEMTANLRTMEDIADLLARLSVLLAEAARIGMPRRRAFLTQASIDADRAYRHVQAAREEPGFP
jgi:hypothetical protein